MLSNIHQQMTFSSTPVMKTTLRKPSVRQLYDYQKTFIVPLSCRTAKEVLVGSSSNESVSLRSPLQLLSNHRTSRMQENFLVRSLHHYGLDWDSPFTRHVYETEVTSVKLNMVYLHMWLLKYHLTHPFKDKAYIREQVI